MGWEWRVFFPFAGPEGSATVDIWALLQSRPRPLWPESRIDVYVVGSAVVGVKLRGGTVLEVKLRTARDESGVEQWDKVLHSRVSKDTSALRATLAAELSKQREWIVSPGVTAEMTQSFEDALALASSELVFIALSKQRTTHHHGSVSVEQTDIVVEGFLGAQKWRSVCLEGKKEDLNRLLQKKVAVSLSSTPGKGAAGALAETVLGEYLTQVAGPPRGYPEFVGKLHSSQTYRQQ